VDSDGVKLQAATPEAEARLGRSLAVSGTTIVAGAYLQNLTGANDAGAAFVFSHNGSTWVQTAELNASDFGTSDQFGLDVDIDGNTIVVGAFAEDSNTDGTGNTIGDSGAAYVFEFDGSNWVETRKLKAQDASASDQFGISVAVDGDIVVVGAFLADTVGSDSGSVYVFARGTTATHGTPWAQTQVIHSPFGGVNDQFGRSVDVANGVVIAGAPNADRVLADGTVVKAYGGVHSWQVSPANRGPGSGFTITAVSAPARGSATTDGTTVTFNPGNDFDFLNPGEFVTETFTYTVQVAGGGTATGQITVTVTGKNDSPVAGNDTFSVGEDGPALTGDLLGNDLDDDQNTSLVIVNVNGSVAQVGTGLTLASGAVLTVNADGTFTYDPNGQFESLAQGQTATDTFTYQVTDASGQIIHQAVDGTFVGEAEIFSSRTGQGGNFWEVTGESGPQNVNGYTGSREGSFVQVPEAGGALLPPAPGVQGQPGISYQVEVTEAGTYQLFVRAAGYDGNSDSLYATVLHHGDGASGGAPDWYRVNVPVGGFQWIGSGAPESTNATDPGVAMNFTLGVGIHTIVLSPREDGVAVDSWMLRKSDSPVAAPGATETGPKAQQSATVTITIHGENDAPTATDDTAAAVEAGGIVNGTPGTNPSGNVIAGGIPDSDVDAGTVLAVTAINGSAVGAGTTSADGTVVAGTYGTLTIGADGSYRYVVDQAAAESLAPGDAPTDVFTYTVSDGTATDTATLTVTITGANDAPVITSTATASVAENSTGTILDVQSADPEGLSEGAGLTYLISGGTDAALFTIDPATGALSFRAAPDHENPLDAGADNIYDVQVRVSDGSLSTTQDIAVTVTDVDAVVSIAVLDADRAEGNAGNTPYTFTVTRSGDTSGAASVGYTVSGAADAADFGGSLPSGTVQFADGETSRTLTLDVSGDAAPEADEAFTVTLGSPVAAVIATGSAAGTIRNDDTATADLSVTTQGSESGPTAIVFTVTLDKVNDTGAAITFDLADAGTGTATSGSDYDAIPAGATITVAAGASTGTYTLLVLDDILVEGVETVTATISNSTNPAVGIGTATATADIADADTATVSIAATTDAEEPGTDGRFTVTLSAPSATDTVVRYTVTGTATAGDDYTTLSGSVTIPAGQTTAFIDVSVLDDGIVEGAEDIVVTLDTVISGDFGGRIAVSAAPDDTATVHLASEDTSAGGLPELFGPLANSFRDLGQTDSLFAGLASFDTVNGFGDRYPGVGFGLYEGGPLGTGGGAGLVPVFSGLGAFGWGVQLVVYDRLGFPITSVNATIGESGSWLVALPGVDLSDAAAVQVRITPPYTGYEAVQPTVFGADITGLFGSWMDLFETGQLAAQGDDILGQLLDTEEISD
jgi:VCBS repeat-containing protein